MRRKKFALNTISALIKQIVFVVCGFVLPRYILTYFGSSVNGLLTSITQFLGFIAFLEMGIGPVIQSNLYKPLAEKNESEISKIILSSERFFKKIAGIFILYIIVLIYIFPILINNDFGFVYTGSLLVIISVSTFAQYYFGITYQLLLNADQRAYIQISLQTVTILLNTIVSVILMKMGCTIHVVKLFTAIIYLIRPFGQMIYVHRKYNIDKTIKFEGEPIKQKWNGFAQHLAAVVVQSTDVTVLTIFSTLQSVSIYSVYYNVVYGINNTVMTMVTGLESLWGNMIAKEEKERLNDTFEFVEWAMHSGCTLLFSITDVLLVPFIKVYTDGVTDANYIAPIFGALLVLSYGMQCLRVPYFRIIKAAGHYKQTQNGSFIQMAINIVLSVALVFKFGLNGVAIGTFIAMFYHTTYFAWYLRKNILKRDFRIYVKYVLIDGLTVLLSVVSTHWISLPSVSYMSWILLAIIVACICLVVTVVMNVLFYNSFVKRCYLTIKRKFASK